MACDYCCVSSDCCGNCACCPRVGSGTQPASAELVVDRAGAPAPSTTSDSASVSQSLEEAVRQLAQRLSDLAYSEGHIGPVALAHRMAEVIDDSDLILAVSAPLKARIAELEGMIRVPAPELSHDAPEMIVRTEPHPLQALYDDPKWRENYFRGLEGEFARLSRRTLARMLVNRISQCGCAPVSTERSESSGTLQGDSAENETLKLRSALAEAKGEIELARKDKDHSAALAAAPPIPDVAETETASELKDRLWSAIKAYGEHCRSAAAGACLIDLEWCKVVEAADAYSRCFRTTSIPVAQARAALIKAADDYMQCCSAERPDFEDAADQLIRAVEAACRNQATTEVSSPTAASSAQKITPSNSSTSDALAALREQIDQDKALGAHVRHGGRESLEPAAPSTASHNGSVGWLPIETAPKDGSWYWAHCLQNGESGRARYRNGEIRWERTDMEIRLQGYSVSRPPTHWMPFAPPETP